MGSGSSKRYGKRFRIPRDTSPAESGDGRERAHDKSHCDTVRLRWESRGGPGALTMATGGGSRTPRSESFERAPHHFWKKTLGVWDRTQISVMGSCQWAYIVDMAIHPSRLPRGNQDTESRAWNAERKKNGAEKRSNRNRGFPESWGIIANSGRCRSFPFPSSFSHDTNTNSRLHHI